MSQPGSFRPRVVGDATHGKRVRQVKGRLPQFWPQIAHEAAGMVAAFAAPRMSLLLLIGLAICVVAAIADVRRGTIPNALTYPVIVLAPFLHLALVLYSGQPPRAVLLSFGASLLGIFACGAVPYFMWRKHAIGGGDVKLFAAMGGLLLPEWGFEAELYVFVCASLLAPAQLAYQGKLLRTIWNIGLQAVNCLRPAARRTPLAPAAMTWFRLGPCFVLGFLVELVLHWRAS